MPSAFGNGAILPFVLIYLHNVQGIGLGTAGLVLATNAFVSIGAGPVAGTLVDRSGGKRVLASALVFLAVGYTGYVGQEFIPTRAPREGLREAVRLCDV